MHNIYYVSYNSKNENIINIKHVLKNNKVPVRLASWLHTFYDILLYTIRFLCTKYEYVHRNVGNYVFSYIIISI